MVAFIRGYLPLVMYTNHSGGGGGGGGGLSLLFKGCTIRGSTVTTISFQDIVFRHFPGYPIGYQLGHFSILFIPQCSWAPGNG